MRGDGDFIYVCWNCSDILFELNPAVKAQPGRRRVAACMQQLEDGKPIDAADPVPTQTAD